MISDELKHFFAHTAHTFTQAQIKPAYPLVSGHARMFQPVRHDETYWRNRILAYEVLNDIRDIEQMLQVLVAQHVIEIDAVVRITSRIAELKNQVKKKLRES